MIEIEIMFVCAAQALAQARVHIFTPSGVDHLARATVVRHVILECSFSQQSERGLQE